MYKKKYPKPPRSEKSKANTAKLIDDLTKLFDFATQHDTIKNENSKTGNNVKTV